MDLKENWTGKEIPAIEIVFCLLELFQNRSALQIIEQASGCEMAKG